MKYDSSQKDILRAILTTLSLLQRGGKRTPNLWSIFCVAYVFVRPQLATILRLALCFFGSSSPSTVPKNLFSEVHWKRTLEVGMRF